LEVQFSGLILQQIVGIRTAKRWHGKPAPYKISIVVELNQMKCIHRTGENRIGHL
jgi:hypothetical protein